MDGVVPSDLLRALYSLGPRGVGTPGSLCRITIDCIPVHGRSAPHDHAVPLRQTFSLTIRRPLTHQSHSTERCGNTPNPPVSQAPNATSGPHLPANWVPRSPRNEASIDAPPATLTTTAGGRSLSQGRWQTGRTAQRNCPPRNRKRVERQCEREHLPRVSRICCVACVIAPLAPKPECASDPQCQSRLKG